MKLSDIQIDGLRVIREGEFSSLGLCGAKAGLPLLTFAGSMRYLKAALANPDVTCVLVSEELLNAEILGTKPIGICSGDDIRILFFRIHNLLAEGKENYPYRREIVRTRFGKNYQSYPFTSISSENVVIGDNVTIEPYVRIFENVTIGDNCIIRSGTVLGGTGLEFIRMGSEEILPVTHCGGLVIGQNVEIQYNCNVSRSLFPWDDTVIGDHTKIESLVHVAHGARLGKRGLIAASACIGGSAEIGDDVWIGPNATISSEVKISNHARVNLGAVVAGNVKEGQTVSGNFAIDHAKFLRDQMSRQL